MGGLCNGVNWVVGTEEACNKRRWILLICVYWLTQDQGASRRGLSLGA